MFQSLFRQAQAVLDRSVDHVAKRVAMAVPFIVAAGFGAAALAVWLTREYGALVANLLLAGLFCVIGLVVIAVLASRTPKTGVMPESEPAPQSEAKLSEGLTSGLSSSDRELLMSLATTVAPVAGPMVVRVLMRNLALVAVIGVILFVLTRPSAGAADAAPAADLRASP